MHCTIVCYKASSRFSRRGRGGSGRLFGGCESILDLTHRALYHVLDRALEDTVVDLLRVELLVDVVGQPVREEPEVALVVDLEIVGEDHRLVVRRHQKVGLRAVLVGVCEGVPAADAVLVELRVEQDAGLGVQERSGSLAVRPSASDHLCFSSNNP